MSSPQEILLSRVRVIESHLASGTEEEKAELMPKLDSLRAAVDAMNAAYETRLAEVRERNATAMTELQNLSKRVERRASASARAEEQARAEKIEKVKKIQMEKAEKAARAAAAATAAAAAEKTFQQSVPYYPQQVMMPSPLPGNPIDMAILMSAMQPAYEPVVLPLAWTDSMYSSAPLSSPLPFASPVSIPQMSPISEYAMSPSPASSPFIACATPECWDDHDRIGALLVRPNQLAY